MTNTTDNDRLRAELREAQHQGGLWKANYERTLKERDAAASALQPYVSSLDAPLAEQVRELANNYDSRGGALDAARAKCGRLRTLVDLSELADIRTAVLAQEAAEARCAALVGAGDVLQRKLREVTGMQYPDGMPPDQVRGGSAVMAVAGWLVLQQSAPEPQPPEHDKACQACCGACGKILCECTCVDEPQPCAECVELDVQLQNTQADYGTIQFENERLREALRGVLLSADCSWEARDVGHDWREACEQARAALPPADEQAPNHKCGCIEGGDCRCGAVEAVAAELDGSTWDRDPPKVYGEPEPPTEYRCPCGYMRWRSSTGVGNKCDRCLAYVGAHPRREGRGR